MGLLNELESNKYTSVFELIKNEETYDKNQRVISGLEAFYLCHKRYELLQKILVPIKNTLGEDITIISVNFNRAMQDETAITIKYLVNDRLNIMVVSIFDLEIVDIVLSDRLIDNDTFLEANRDIISKVIHELDDFQYFDEEEIVLKSSSKKFIASDNYNDFIIKNSEGKTFLIGTNHLLYSKDKKLYTPKNITIDNDIKEILMDEETIQDIYRNLRIYEENLPKTLIKKTN